MNAKEHIETWEKIQELRVALEDIVKKKMEQIMILIFMVLF